MRAFLSVAVVACILQACGSTTIVETQAAPIDEAGSVPIEAGPPVDAGAPDPTYPASHASPRQLLRLAGPVLPHPVVIPVFFGDDADRTKTETLLKQLPGSDYWKLLGEYGVGDLSIGASVVIAETAPTTYSLANIETKVKALWTRAESPAPAPDGTQIYAVFFPTQTKLLQTDGSAFCLAGGAYHDSQDTSYAFAIVPHCSGSFDEFALSATHELIEAATDPYPLVNPAWAGADLAHVADRGEVGDLCDYGGQIGVGGGVALFGTTVERVYSNTMAATGRDPCVPSLGPNVAYFNAAPVVEDDLVSKDVVLGDLPAKGVKVKVGEKKTIELGLFSDREVASWKVSARATNIATYEPSTDITFSWSQTSGANGDKIQLTIERTGASESGENVKIYSSTSKAIWSDSIFVH